MLLDSTQTGKIMITPGGLILTERPSYMGALQAWRAYQAEFVTVPVDDDGLRVDLLDDALCAGPKFMYILPNFQNPGGVTLSLERRRQLIEIADHYGVPIIEDDPYGELRYEGDHLPSLVVIDAERMKSHSLRAPNGDAYYALEHTPGNGRAYMRGNVIYLSTFSKTLAPGLRLAWLVAPVEVVQRGVIVFENMEPAPEEVLEVPVVLAFSARFPKAQLSNPVVLKRRDDMPIAVFEPPVVLN